MAARKGGLGKGFEALMQSNTMDDELGEKATLSINDIEPNRGQPRKTFSEESLSELADSIRERTGLYLSDGVQYGRTGEKFLRLNIACPRVRLEDGLRRLREGIAGYRQ